MRLPCIRPTAFLTLLRRSSRDLSVVVPGVNVSSAVTTPLAADKPFVTTFPFGLTNKSSTEGYYTSALDMDKPLLLTHGSAVFMAAARADARKRLGMCEDEMSAKLEANVLEHLRDVNTAKVNFLNSRVVHDRTDIKAALVNFFAETGGIGMLLGGKSVGKSLLLEELVRNRDIMGEDGKTRAFIYIDARLVHDNLLKGLEKALTCERQELSTTEAWSWFHGSSSRQRRAQSERPGVTFSAMPPPPRGIFFKDVEFEGTLEAIRVKLSFAKTSTNEKPSLVTMDENIELLQRVTALAEKQKLYLCLVIDEANLMFGTPTSVFPSRPSPSLAPEDVRRLATSKLMLDGLISLSKQCRSLNVLLVSSDYAYPFRLKTTLAMNNISHLLFAGEVPPSEMRDLLQHKWRMGALLSDVFLAFYGGHIHMASHAVADLANGLDKFECGKAAHKGASGSIVRCLESGSKGVGAMLYAVAAKGFAPVKKDDDPTAQLLAEENLAGLIDTSGTIVGVSRELLAGAKYGVAPSLQFTRHLIAEELYKVKEEAEAKVKGGGR